MSRKWLRRIGFGFLALLLLAAIVLYGEWKYTRMEGEKRRDEVVRKLDQADPNWRTTALTDERNAKLPPADQNGAEQALKAVKLVPQSFKDWAFPKWSSELKPGVLPYDDDWTDALLFHIDCEVALSEARKLRHMPEGGFAIRFKEPDPISTDLENTQKLRTASALLSFDSMMLASFDKPDAAIESTHAVLHVASALGDEPALISMLIRMSIVANAKMSTERVLGRTEPKSGLAELQTAMAKELHVPRLKIGLRGDRAAFYRLLENLDNGAISLTAIDNGRSSETLGGRLAFRYYKKYLPNQQALFLEIFDEFIAADKLNGPDRRAAFDAIAIPPQTYENTLIRALLPAVNKVEAAEFRARANLGTSIAAIACERYRIQFGKWPENLTAIPKSILSTIPIDPYTGEPVLFAKLENGLVRYTTGPDLSDDGGIDLTDKGDPGTDFGFRLYDPKHRAKAPPPKEPNPVDE